MWCGIGDLMTICICVLEIVELKRKGNFGTNV